MCGRAAASEAAARAAEAAEADKAAALDALREEKAAALMTSMEMAAATAAEERDALSKAKAAGRGFHRLAIGQAGHSNAITERLIVGWGELLTRGIDTVTGDGVASRLFVQLAIIAHFDGLCRGNIGAVCVYAI